MIELKKYTLRTDQGPYLELNEDDVEVDLSNNLFMLFDGFGGSNVGDKTVRELKDNIKKFYTRIGGDPDSTLPFYYSYRYLLEGNALINSMHYAHKLLIEQNSQLEISSRGGSSAVVGALDENIITLSSTGNCLCYLFRDGHLDTLMSPDTVSYFSFDHYQRHYHTAPLSGFGLFEDLHLNVKELKLMDGDTLIFLSDGVYSRLDRSEVIFVLNKQNSTDEEKIDDLFDMANERGNMDNQSALIIQF
jgi:serine/threonine protein phosphatase PrpC